MTFLRLPLCHGSELGIFISLIACNWHLTYRFCSPASCAPVSHDSIGTLVTWHHKQWQDVTTCVGARPCKEHLMPFLPCSTYSRNSLVPCLDCFVLFYLVLFVASFAPMSLVLYLARLIFHTRLALYFYFIYCFSCSFTVSYTLWAHIFKSCGLRAYFLSFLLSLIQFLVTWGLFQNSFAKLLSACLDQHLSYPLRRSRLSAYSFGSLPPSPLGFLHLHIEVHLILLCQQVRWLLPQLLQDLR
jgi:hypothetical protein